MLTLNFPGLVSCFAADWRVSAVPSPFQEKPKFLTTPQPQSVGM